MGDATWILLTDGYYIKLLFKSDDDAELHTYREEDFEKSSDITYELITRYKNNRIAEEKRLSSSSADIPAYTFSKVANFLEEKHKSNIFKSLVIVAPQDILEVVEQSFSGSLLNVITNKISGDYLKLSQDKLQNLLAKEMVATQQ